MKNLLKKFNLTLTISLAVIIALFPDFFKETGRLLIRYFSNNKTEVMLFTITLILIYICRQCYVIKKQIKEES